ncbi:MAG: hypothetical protein ACTSU4_02535 [Promethearchaeota archaeon]
MVKSPIFRYFCLFYILFILSFSCFFIPNVQAQVETIEPDYGDLPQIDGYINRSINEWNGALKITLTLNSSSSPSDKGLPIDFWVMQNNSGLFFCFQLDLENHENYEFMGILISRSKAQNFYDAKILQFKNVVQNNSEFLDLHIENNVYKRDTKINGSAAAQLDEKTMIYEFQIPVNTSGEEKDVFLDYGEEYAFKIIFGIGLSYPTSILKEAIVNIYIEYPPSTPSGFDYDRLFLILSILTFSALGALYGFYIYKIIILKKKLKTIRGWHAKRQKN